MLCCVHSATMIFFFFLVCAFFFCSILVDGLLRIYLRTIYLVKIENFLLEAWSLSIEWGGGGWEHGAGGIFELGEVNAYRMCASATNKQ